MAVKPETTFTASVHRHLPVDLYRIKNNNAFNGGQPDVWYSGMKADLWVEYKFITLPKRDGTVIDLVSGKNPDISYLQQDWLKSRAREGRNVGVIVGCKEGGVWLPALAWVSPLNAAAFKKMILSRSELANIIVLNVS